MRCGELAILHSNKTDDYISLVERQSRMFRNGEAQAGRELDGAISTSKVAMHEAQREWNEHRESHSPVTQI